MTEAGLKVDNATKGQNGGRSQSAIAATPDEGISQGWRFSLFLPLLLLLLSRSVITQRLLDRR